MYKAATDKKYKITNNKVQTISVCDSKNKRYILTQGQSCIIDLKIMPMAGIVIEELKVKGNNDVDEIEKTDEKKIIESKVK